MGRNEEMWFYNVVLLLAIQVSMFGFGMYEWKENEEKWFIMVHSLLVSQG